MQFAQRQRLDRDRWKPLLAALILGLGLGFAGPFGSNPAYPTVIRYTFWLTMTLAGAVAAIAADRLVSTRLVQGQFARTVIISIVSAIPMTFVVAWTMTLLQPGRFFSPKQLFSLYGAVAAVQLLIVLVSLRRSPSAVHGGDTDLRQLPGAVAHASFPSALLAKLPPVIGTTILALETEDHYLRVHTAAGSALALMRMSDAVAMIDPALGTQVHRRWWVAQSAVAGLEADRQKLCLRLVDDRLIPVGRTYAAAVRARFSRQSPRP